MKNELWTWRRLFPSSFGGPLLLSAYTLWVTPTSDFDNWSFSSYSESSVSVLSYAGQFPVSRSSLKQWSKDAVWSIILTCSKKSNLVAMNSFPKYKKCSSSVTQVTNCTIKNKTCYGCISQMVGILQSKETFPEWMVAFKSLDVHLSIS